jgi:hypothetical protein
MFSHNAIAHLDPTGASGNSLSADKFNDIVMCEQGYASQ